MDTDKEKSNKAKGFLTNTSSLIILQMANYVLPFILLPYLTRVLGTELYGVVAFGFAISQIAIILTDYGFNLSSTYKIARDRDNHSFVENMISSVLILKVFLLSATFLLFAIYILLENKYDAYEPFLWLMMLSVLGQTFQPIWFFQGIEKMAYITLYVLIARSVYLILVLLLVNNADDYYLVAVANGVSHLLAAAVGIIIMFSYSYRFVIPPRRFVLSIFKESTAFFWSRAAVATYTSCGVFFIGLFGTPVQIAHYSAAEQLYKGARSVFEPVAQALYPHMAKERNYPLFFKTMKICVALTFAGLIFGIFAGQWFVDILFGEGFEGVYIILLVFLFTLLVAVPSVLLGYPFFGALGRIRLANNSVIYAGALQIILLLICYVFELFAGFYIALTVMIVESFVFALRIYWAKSFMKELRVK